MISECIYISKHHAVHLKCIQIFSCQVCPNKVEKAREQTKDDQELPRRKIQIVNKHLKNLPS
jgi:hypothetical protein